MVDDADKEERKREYNRLAQREFRRRRKEHLKTLEQAQKMQDSEQFGEIERLRLQNSQLKRENEALKAQLYGSSMPSQMMQMPSMLSSSSQSRSYSASPSISSTIDSVSGPGSPPAMTSADVVGLSSLSLSSTMLPPSMQAYSDVMPLNNLLSQPYSMVHSSSSRHHSLGSPEVTDVGDPRSTMGGRFQSMNRPIGTPASQVLQQQDCNTNSNVAVLTPYDRIKYNSSLFQTFQPILSPSATPGRHLSILRSMAPSLPRIFQPTKSQISTSHFYFVDMLASPSLRDRLIDAGHEVSERFIREFSCFDGNATKMDELLIWGEDPNDETAWEFSQSMLERWTWLLGSEWVQRANFWRGQRGAQLLPMPPNSTW